MAKKTEEIIVRSCRYNGRSIACEWEQGGDPCARTFHDNPLPSFEKSLKALAEHVCTLCELSSKEAEKIEATGITIRPLGDDNHQALITAKKKIRKGKRAFNIATPLLAMYPATDAEKKGSDSMDEAEAKAIAKFEAEVKKYILGERAQGKLALEEGPADKEKGKGKTVPDNTEQFPGMTEAGDGGKK
jgi:hypothetical protein